MLGQRQNRVPPANVQTTLEAHVRPRIAGDDGAGVGLADFELYKHVVAGCVLQRKTRMRPEWVRK
jgi:hypothetical protein